MSEEYDNTNRFSLFKNLKGKKENEKAPDMTGKITIGDEVLEALNNGETEFRLAAWSNNHDKVGKYLSGSIQPFPARDDDEEDDFEEEDDFDDEDDF